MVGKCKQLYVLTAGLVSVRNDTWIIHEYTKQIKGFTDAHSPLVSDYSQVLSAQQDSLTSIYLALISYYFRVQKCMAGVTHKYFQLVSNRS